MQFLRTLFWVVLAVAAAIFSFRNWTNVPLLLWGGIVADIKLPVLMFGVFALGLAPGLILYRTTRWRYRRKLDLAERQLADMRGPDAPVVVPARGDAPITVPPALS